MSKQLRDKIESMRSKKTDGRDLRQNATKEEFSPLFDSSPLPSPSHSCLAGNSKPSSHSQWPSSSSFFSLITSLLPTKNSTDERQKREEEDSYIRYKKSVWGIYNVSMYFNIDKALLILYIPWFTLIFTIHKNFKICCFGKIRVFFYQK